MCKEKEARETARLARLGATRWGMLAAFALGFLAAELLHVLTGVH